jgi:hypothetical protein
MSEDGVNPVQMRGRLGQDEELRAVRVRALVRHRQQEWPETRKTFLVSFMRNKGAGKIGTERESLF